MARLQSSVKESVAGRTITRFLRFGVLRGLRSVEIDPEDFRRYLADKHHLWVPDFARMKDVPTERLDAIAKVLIRTAERVALAEGAGFGLGGMITFLPDASLLTIITLRLIQRLSLLYGFEVHGRDQRIEMWKAAAAATGIDYGKDLAEKQILERLAPRIAERFAATSKCSKLAVAWLKPPVLDLLVQHGFNLQYVDPHGRNELHLALAPPVVPPPGGIEYLLHSGVPLNARDSSGKTPLAYWREPRDFESHWFTTWLFERLGDDSYPQEQRENRARISALLERSGALL